MKELKILLTSETLSIKGNVLSLVPTGNGAVFGMGGPKGWVWSWLLLPLGFMLQSFICISSYWLTKTVLVGDTYLLQWCSRMWGVLQHLLCRNGPPMAGPVCSPLHLSLNANPLFHTGLLLQILKPKFIFFTASSLLFSRLSVTDSENCGGWQGSLGTLSYSTAHRRVSYSRLLGAMSS